MTLLVLLFCSWLCDAQQLKEEKLLSSETKFSVPIIMHRMSVWHTGRLARNALFAFADETLFAPDMSLAGELAMIKKAGADVVVIEKGMELYTDDAAVRNSGMKVILMANLSPLILKRWDADHKKWQNVVSYFIHLLDFAKKHPKLFYHVNGRPLLWVFAARNFEPAEFTRIRQELKKRGYDSIIYFQAVNIKFKKEKTVYDYLNAYDGIFIWGGGYDATKQVLDFAEKARTQILKETGIRKGIVLTSKNGHWRKEKGSMIVKHGTSEFRQTMELAWKAKAQGLIIESWNDFSENHNIEPSMMNSFVMYDLCRYYGSIGKEKTFYVDNPGIYLSARREILSLENYELELLHLPVKEKLSGVKIVIRDEKGKLLYSTTDLDIKNSDAKAFTLTLKPEIFKNAKVIVPYVKINGKELYASMFTPVRRTRLNHPFAYHVSLAKTMHPEEVEFKVDKSNMARFSIRNSTTIKRLEIIKNYKPVYEPAYHAKMQKLAGDKQEVKTLCLRWDMPYSDKFMRAKDRKMFLTAHNAKIFDSFLCYTNDSAKIIEKDYPSKLVWSQQKYGMHNEMQLSVSINDKSYFVLEFPKVGKKVKIDCKELQEKKLLEYRLYKLMMLQVYFEQKPVGFALDLNSKESQGEIRLATSGNMAENIYFLRAVDSDDRIYRSLPVIQDSNNPVKDVTLDFNSPGRILFDLSDNDFNGELGGSFERDGRYSDTQVPARKNGKLFFDGNDIIQMKPCLIPRGKYKFTIGLTPTAIGNGKTQCILDNPDSINLTILKDGRLIVSTLVATDNKRYKISGRQTLKNNQHYIISVENDLKSLSLYIDGKLDAKVKLPYSLLKKTNSHTSIGAFVERGIHLSGGEKGFIGTIDSFKIECR